jgi:hypothetical protein
VSLPVHALQTIASAMRLGMRSRGRRLRPSVPVTPWFLLLKRAPAGEPRQRVSLCDELRALRHCEIRRPRVGEIVDRAAQALFSNQTTIAASPQRLHTGYVQRAIVGVARMHRHEPNPGGVEDLLSGTQVAGRPVAYLMEGESARAVAKGQPR